MSLAPQNPTNEDFARIAEYRPQLLQLANQLVSQQMQARIDPSDVVQETLLAASNNLSQADSIKVPLLVWLYKLLRQRIIDAKRKHLGSSKRSVKHEKFFTTATSYQYVLDHLPAHYQPRPPSELSASMRLQKLDQALRSLDPETETLLRQRYFEGISLAEIAERLGISLSAAKMRHLRAVQELRKVLEHS
ncbi:MAG: sigma-70 family RNA polymerase sigma factor [Planctomycetes bacterium]|nr:sigma-70 family RNA polymerase sigma factor [Planctomycetota bacterium]